MDKSSIHGFSVMEMVIVLALAILILGVLLIRTKGLGDQAQIETARGDLRSIQTSINAYYLNHNQTYPSGSDWQNNDLVNDNPRVLRQVLYDPFRASNTEYSYFISGNGKYYVAFSYGPNGTADITGINNSGILTGSASGDDVFVTNGTGTFS